jgi:hypothetical protein
MFLGIASQFDRSSIPTDPKRRVLQVPIPPDASGRPAYDRALLWPKERERIRAAHEVKVRENILHRDQLVTLCANDAEARRDDQILCSRDPVYWINNWVCVVDPRLGEKATIDPFVLYDTQEREARFFVDEFLVADEMLWLIEKSRAWGATWLMAALTAWGFLYRENWNVLIGAPNQDDVDKGGISSDHNSIFGKLRFLLRHLPPWQVPPAILTSVKFNKNFLLKHPDKDNSIHGRQFCSNWGRSLRFLYTIADEAAHSLNYRAASVNYGNTSNRNIALSTHKGTTEFSEMCAAAKDDPTADRVVSTLWWAENPTLDTDVYWGWRAKYGWEKTAQERDIDQQGSVGLAIYQDFDVAVNVITARAEVKDEDGMVLVEACRELDYDPNLPLGVSVDPGMGPDPFALIWWQPNRAEKLIHVIDAIQYEGRPGPYFVPYLLGYLPETTLDGFPWAEKYEYDVAEMEIVKRHARWGALDSSLCFGDCYGASAAVKVSSGLSLYETWSAYGVPMMYPVKISNKEEAVQRTASMLGRVRIAGRLLTQRTQSKQTPTFVQAIKMYAWVQRESPNGLPLARVPKHDAHCHYNDCLQFIAKYEEGDDPRVTPMAPSALRPRDATGRQQFFRSPHATLSAPSGYSIDRPPE